ncbi:division/cell wall cluster transcriptional repressor MraZ [Desulfitibacter alkalitolerans]|uniref:division/cell wall cluster transcriptional repressor MraZ n=1 Tax=Desulfitibacter alkalitolerans TaxID=264641 RepID=UPI000482BE50|nr:division/cell wall cluster transcriptional repressor MraZ [Desulfitibacter alkalitolerans]
MFMGEYQHSLDPKGRLIVPSKFRDGLGQNFVITKGLDNCLFVYPMEEWLVIEKKLKNLPFTKADARAFVRFFFSGANECELDKQGRILLPSNLREYAKLDKDVVIIGVSSRIEIWSKEVWESYSQNEEMDYEGIAEKLQDIDINI